MDSNLRSPTDTVVDSSSQFYSHDGLAPSITVFATGDRKFESSSLQRRDAMGRAAKMATSSLQQPMECRDAPARSPGPPRDSDRLDAATGQNRATKRPPPPPCWSPARATPAPPSPARHVAPASIAPCDIIYYLLRRKSNPNPERQSMMIRSQLPEALAGQAISRSSGRAAQRESGPPAPAPAGSNRSRHGGDEMSEAFG
jgi:hypothetical protein